VKERGVERILRAEKVKTPGMLGKEGWLIVTDERLLFSSKNDLTSRHYWVANLVDVDSAVAGKPSLSFGIYKLDVLYRKSGRREAIEFRQVSVTSGFLLGAASRLEANPMTGLEHAIAQARAALRGPQVAVSHPAPTAARAAPRRKTKRCPDCAEDVMAEARVCRFCGHRWTDEPAVDSPAPVATEFTSDYWRDRFTGPDAADHFEINRKWRRQKGMAPIDVQETGTPGTSDHELLVEWRPDDQ
jgi:hypothetical protein